jgi:Zinc dependent phospholipase C
MEEPTMPASIVHMLISRKVRNGLKIDPELKEYPNFKKFIEDVLEKNQTFMELGSLGPDLPYYGGMNLFWAIWHSIWHEHDMPTGVEQWSYQLHGIDTNVFPLKMLETVFQDRSFEHEGWADEDNKKLAFICGYLTHMAADQIIHPIINLIAGPYYQRDEARIKHRECELTQDLFLLDLEEGIKNFRKINFKSWANIKKSSAYSMQLRLRYLIQRGFIEAYYVAPSKDEVGDWVKGTLASLLYLNAFISPYKSALKNLIPGSEKYQEYIELKPPINAFLATKRQYEKVVGNKKYGDFIKNAIELATIYIKTTFKIYDGNISEDLIADKFKKVVSGADLSSPLENDILAISRKAYKQW